LTEIIFRDTRIEKSNCLRHRAKAGSSELKHWQEMGHIVDRVLHLGRQGQSAALAIVTHIFGSAYRRPGAKLLIEPSGGVLGGVSGGCLEEDVRQVGLAVLGSGRARVLSYDTSSDETTVFGLGLGCGGRVDVLVLPVTPTLAEGVFGPVKDSLQQDEGFALSAVVEDGREGSLLVVGPHGKIAGGLGDPGLEARASAAAQAALETKKAIRDSAASPPIFTEVLLPPPKVLVCGGGDDARPLVELAASVGFAVYVADHRSGLLTQERFPAARKLLKLRAQHPSSELPADRSTYAVVKTHAYEHDRAWVERLLGSDVPYIGVLGPKVRVQKILAALGAQDRERVFGPVGLDLGADGPEQVALSVVSEILAVTSRRNAGHLRDREAALHAD